MKYPPLNATVTYENALGELVTGRVVGLDHIVKGLDIVVVTIRTSRDYTVRMMPQDLSWTVEGALDADDLAELLELVREVRNEALNGERPGTSANDLAGLIVKLEAMAA